MRAIAPSLMVMYWAERMELEEGSVQEMINPEDPESRQHVLVIEFRDARPVQVKGKKRMLDSDGQPVLWKTPLLSEQTGASTASGSIPLLVERRNRNFREFLLNFVNRAADADEDVVEKVREQALQAVPVQPGALWADTSKGAMVDDIGVAPIPDCPASLVDLMDDLKREPFYRGQISAEALHVTDARLPNLASLTRPLSADLAKAIKEGSGVDSLYAHQAQAVNAVEEGFNVIVSTSTSRHEKLPWSQLGGFMSDIVNAFLQALAQDQKRALMEILMKSANLATVQVDTYDGDTPLRDGSRDDIRENASIIFTNPDMLHLSILPGHKTWKTWLEKLRFVMAGFFGLSPSTIRVMDVNGAPTGRKLHAIWNPPLKDPARPSQGRASPLEDTVRLVSFLMSRGIRAICFAKVRQMCEILTKELQTFLREESPSLVPRVMSYRGGYTPEDRRQIEGKMFRGELLCIVATNALELGVDIGSLDVVIHMGFPFNLASYRQQSGRAGRRERDSMSIMIADGDNPLDQFYAGQPQALYDAEVETSGVDLGNALILEAHVQCAAYEWPIDFDRDSTFFASDKETMDVLEDICKRHLRWDSIWKIFFAQAKYTSHPSRQITIRSIDEDYYRVIDMTTHRDIEEVEAARVPFTLYEGSIFLHQGAAYLVYEVNEVQKCARVRPTTVDYITSPRDFTNVDPVKTTETLAVSGVQDLTEDSKKIPKFLETQGAHVLPGPHSIFANYGEIRVCTTVFGYFKINPRTKQILAAIDGADNPPLIKTRFGFWIDAVEAVRAADFDVEYSIHGASHALVSLLPTCVTMPTTGQTDIRTECKHPAATRKRPPRLIVYDSASGARSGLMHKAFQHAPSLLQQAAQVVADCACEKGCPNCIHRMSCKEHNEALNKVGALMILRSMAGLVASVEPM
ncbi:hypothetical protein HKX48_003773 [Thoreauomyces humboldtii]|nr:hypothetical protein HKX48_003773 [Thoreauomyces humboldtii]